MTEIVDASTSTVTKQSFDAWGNKRSVSDWRNAATYNLFANRGFTGHEHLEEFDLINMNGRVYDPLIEMFLSPDNFVQNPDLTQNFNRYGYCVNNPLIYTDPSGEFIFTIIGALLAPVTGGASLAIGIAMDVGGAINLGTKIFQGKIHSFGDGAAAYGIGAAAGAVGYATGGAAFAAVGGAAGGAGGFLAGFAGGAVGGAYAMPIQSIGNSMYFGDPMMTPGQYAAGILTGGLLGGTVNGGIALLKGRTFLNGNIRGEGIQTSTQTPAISEGTLTKGQIRSNVPGDYDIALREWNNIQQQYGITPTQGVPAGFTTTFPDGTNVSGQFYYGGTTNPTGYNIKVIMIPQGLKINKLPPLYIRYHDWR